MIKMTDYLDSKTTMELPNYLAVGYDADGKTRVFYGDSLRCAARVRYFNEVGLEYFLAGEGKLLNTVRKLAEAAHDVPFSKPEYIDC